MSYSFKSLKIILLLLAFNATTKIIAMNVKEFWRYSDGLNCESCTVCPVDYETQAVLTSRQSQPGPTTCSGESHADIRLVRHWQWWSICRIVRLVRKAFKRHRFILIFLNVQRIWMLSVHECAVLVQFLFSLNFRRMLLEGNI